MGMDLDIGCLIRKVHIVAPSLRAIGKMEARY